ncbi:Sodium channel modifier 1 [Euphorbia peplus]|nr:Sodium channel modifier 1 [Euphorbia peplus]
MSVFGGDSWAREAQQRKRRVDDVVLENLDGSSYKKLSSGKYLCLLCPHNPVLDSPLMLSVHCKGSRHIAAESRLKERELAREAELDKRSSLANTHVPSADSTSINKRVRLAVNKPLIQQTRLAASEVLYGKTSEQNSGSRSTVTELGDKLVTNMTSPLVQAYDMSLIQPPPVDFRARREQELKFIQAGWKRDGHGRWYKDENVEFDSDEEDPNVCLC